MYSKFKYVANRQFTGTKANPWRKRAQSNWRNALFKIKAQRAQYAARSFKANYRRKGRFGRPTRYVR